ncbi:MAG: N-acetylmuramoyl-L-alanine amidase family protein [Acidimicrobiales bacterium]
MTAAHHAPRRSGRPRARRRRITVLGGALLLLLVVVALLHGGAGPSHRTALPTTTAARAVDPAKFAAGACVEYPPLRGDRHITVFLDAGHGGRDPGAIGTTESGATIEEAQETLPVELDAARLLRRAGFTVVVSRTAQTTVLRLRPDDVAGSELSLLGAHDDVAARDACANLAHASLLVGIYFDSGSSPANAGSVTTYDTARPFAASNQRFASLLQHDVLTAMNARGWGIPDEGTLPDNNFGSLVQSSSPSPLATAAQNYDHLMLLGPAMAGYFTTPSSMPGAVIEPLFITDPFEGSLANSTPGQQTIAGGIAQAVEQYFRPADVRKPTGRRNATTTT